VLLSPLSLFPLMFPTMRIMRCAVAVKKQHDATAWLGFQDCAVLLGFGRRERRSGILQATGPSTPAELHRRGGMIRPEDGCVTLQSSRSC
jgi:hypothetical protein